MTRHPLMTKLAALALGLLCATGARAEGPSFTKPLSDDGYTEAAPDALKEIGVDEHRSQKVPLDLVFQDEHGKAVKFGDLFASKRPVILQLGYFDCPMLCSLVSRGTVDSLHALTLDAGKDFEYVFVSINPNEKPEQAAEKKDTYSTIYNRPGADAGFHFLTGKQDAITRLAQAVGFKYKWVESARQYSHPAVVMVLTPDGTISRYLYGVTFKPETMRLSLVEASDGKVGSVVDQLILTCFHYDGKQGKYAATAMGMMRVGGVLTMLVLGTVLVRAFRHDAHRAAPEGADGSQQDTSDADEKRRDNSAE